MGKVHEKKSRYIAFRLIGERITPQEMAAGIRSQMEFLYGLHGSGNMSLRLVELKDGLLVLAVDHANLKKLIAGTALVEKPRLVPILVSGTLAGLKRKLEQKQKPEPAK